MADPRDPFLSTEQLEIANHVAALWIKLMTPVPLGPGFYNNAPPPQVRSSQMAGGDPNPQSATAAINDMDNDERYRNATSGFAFDRTQDLSLADLDLLLEHSHKSWCGGTMNPLQRLANLCCGNGRRIVATVSSESALESLSDIHLPVDSLAQIHNFIRQRERSGVIGGMTSSTDAPHANDMYAHLLGASLYDDVKFLVDGDMVLTFFKNSAYKMIRLKDMYIRLNVSNTTLQYSHRIASQIKEILARIHDIHQLYVNICLCFRQSASSIGYNEFLQLPTIAPLMNSMYSFERVTNQLVDDEYSMMMRQHMIDAEKAPAEGRLVSVMLSTPLQRYEVAENYMMAVEEQQEREAADEEAANAISSSPMIAGGGGAAVTTGADDAMSSVSQHGPGAMEVEASDAVTVISSSKKKRKRNNAFDDASIIARKRKVLFRHFLFEFSHHGLQHLDGKKKIMVPIFNTNGIFTRCYRELRDSNRNTMTAEDVIYNMFNTLINPLIFEMSDPTSGILEGVIKAINNVKDPQFPEHDSDRRLMSFKDGIFYVPTCHFYRYDELSFSRASTEICARHFHPAGNLFVHSRSTLEMDMKLETELITQRSSCCFIDQNMGPLIAEASENFSYRVEMNVLDKLYPITRENPHRARHPSSSDSSDEVFDLYVDLLTVEFRRWIEATPTIYDETFCHQLGFETDKSNPETYLRELGDVQSNTAARKLHEMVHKGFSFDDDTNPNANRAAAAATTDGQQQQPPVDISADNQTVTSTHPYKVLMESLSTAASSVNLLLDGYQHQELMSDIRKASLLRSKRGIQQMLTETRAIVNEINFGIPARLLQPLAQPPQRVSSSPPQQPPSPPPGPSSFPEMAPPPPRPVPPPAGRPVRNSPNDVDAMRVMPEYEEMRKNVFSTPEHQGFRALMMVYMILGTYLVPRDAHLGLDLPIALWIRGVAGTGKTKAIHRLFEMIYGGDHLALINNNMEVQFGLAPLLRKEVYVAVANEITPDTTFPRNAYLSWVTDGTMRQPAKYKESTEYKLNSKPIVGCNLLPAWPDEGATKTSPGNFSRRSLVDPFEMPLARPLTDADFETILRSQLPTIILRLLHCRRLLVPALCVQSFWRRSAVVVHHWRMNVTSSLRPFQLLIHDLSYFEFGKYYIMSDHDFRKIVEHFKSIYRDIAKFSWDDLYSYLASYDNIIRKDNICYNYCTFGNTHPSKLQTKYIIGLRYSDTALRLFHSGTPYNESVNILSEAEHPTAIQENQRRRRSNVVVPPPLPSTTARQRRVAPVVVPSDDGLTAADEEELLMMGLIGQ